MNEKKPLISIILLSHSTCTHLLTQTIDNILAQKKKNYELILILSPKAEWENRIIHGYLKSLTQIYVSISSNIAFMMNRGAKFAKGAYIHFLVPGDYFLSLYATEKFESFVRDKSFPDLVETDCLLQGEGGSMEVSHFSCDDIKLKNGYIPRMTQAFLIKKEIVEELGGFDQRYRAEGLDLILRLHFSKKKRHLEKWSIVLVQHEQCRIGINRIFGKDLIPIVKEILGWKEFVKFLFRHNPWQFLLCLRDFICQ
jgi:predicted glycosyltransferase involved in capsule biosynthesis